MKSPLGLPVVFVYATEISVATSFTKGIFLNV